MRKFYSDYVRHCTRFYLNHESVPSAISDKVNYNNYVAVSNILSGYDKAKVNLIRRVYIADSITEEVDTLALELNIKPQAVWYIIQGYEKEVATERGLL